MILTAARLSLLCLLGAAAGCDAAGGTAIASTTSLAITPTILPRLLVGDSIRLIAEPRDARGKPTPSAVRWDTSDRAVATVSDAGLLIVLDTGVVTITASADDVTERLSTRISDPTARERFAFAIATQPTAASYPPSPEHSYNGFTNGPPGISVTRRETGSYHVRLRGLGRGSRTEVVLTSAMTSGIKCLPEKWGRLSNPRDLDALVICSTAGGTPADAVFSILVIGQESLPGLAAFARVSPGIPTPDPSWSSSGTVRAVVAGVGLTDLRLGLPIATGDNVNTYVMAHGTSAVACRSLGRNLADVLSVRCTDPVGENSDADFVALAIAEGRSGRRFGMAYSDQIHLATYIPHRTYAKNSTGGAITGHRHGTGRYRITFHEWGETGPQAVMVSAFVEAAFCNAVAVHLADGIDQAIEVECYDSGGRLENSRFTVLIIE